MKKINKFLSCTLTLGLAASFAACGPRIDGEFDDKANNIYIQVYTGGIGDEWLNEVVQEFNEKYYSEDSSKKWVMNVLKTNNKDDGANFYEAFNSGTAAADIYFTANPTMWSEMISKNYLLDLTDVYASKPDGENGKSVSEKLSVADARYKLLYTNNGTASGIYGLPYHESFAGMVVNKEVFVKNGWFTAASASEKTAAEEDLGVALKEDTYQMRKVLVRADLTSSPKYSDVVLTAGKDGKYGTVDDGQPTNMTEWNAMMNKISSAKYKAFLWAGKYPEYTNHTLSNVLGQYLGEEQMNKWLMFGDEEYTFTDENGNAVTVNTQSRANSYKIPELKKALEFVSEQMSKNAYSKSITALDTHTDTQGYFIYGENSSTMEKAAILCDGTWWENEAKSKLKVIDAYGVNEYAFLFAPSFEGQKLANTDSWMTMAEMGSVFARNTDNAEKASKIKEFLSMTLSDKCLKHFTLTTGCMRPYDYTLTEAELAELTPFGRNSWAIYHSENVKFGRNPLLLNLGTSSVGMNGEYTSFVNNSIYEAPMSAFIKNISAKDVFDGMYVYRNNNVN